MLSSKRLIRDFFTARKITSIKHLSTSQASVVASDQSLPPPPDSPPQQTPSPPDQQARTQPSSSAWYHEQTLIHGDPYWQRLAPYKNVPESDFLKYDWQVKNKVEAKAVQKGKLLEFLAQVLPQTIPASKKQSRFWNTARARTVFMEDVCAALYSAGMQIKLSPHILSRIDWNNPVDDPVRQQFIPLQSEKKKDSPFLTLDSLCEQKHTPVKGLVHRYPTKALFLAQTMCPVYCGCCTRSYGVGPKTTFTKATVRASERGLDERLDYIRQTPAITDVTVSGGDSYMVDHKHLHYIGEQLLAMPHIRRLRIATKGLAVNPERITDEGDRWTEAVLDLSEQGRDMGKEVAIHTHFNHPHEITWVTHKAMRRLFKEAVMVRNQTVLLKNVNDDVKTMSHLITSLADINIEPYYVYQCDMVKGIEHMRTPLSKIINLQKQITGTIGGHKLPKFIVDLPGGGGKRGCTTYESYDEKTGVSTWTAPAVAGDMVFTYHDPLPESDVD